MTSDAIYHGQSHVLTRLGVGGTTGFYRVKQGDFSAGLYPDFLADTDGDRVSLFD
jgi:hypothetical protein